LWGCVGLVLMLHLWLLETWLVPVRLPAPLPAAVQLRLLPTPALPAQTTGPAVAPIKPAPATKLPTLDGVVAEGRAQRPTAAPALETSAPEPAAISPPALPDTEPLPVYATAAPPSRRLHYRIERGPQHGEAVLEWAQQDGRYTLQLTAELAGRAVLGSISRGAFDHAGLAPERFVETRRQRELRAANFDRDEGRIAFSGPVHQHPLAGGAQDRLSWIVQLAAVLEADPARTEVRLSVTGARGDSSVWHFVRVAPDEPGDTGRSLHFRREARAAHDTHVDIWLDPDTHHLPVRLALRFHERGATTTLWRVER
jgi:hypothetical protein